MKKNVTIIGAGISGLTAAYYLSKNSDYEIDIFESRDRVGGRIYSEKIGTDSYIDHGGFMFLPYYKNAFNLIEELGLTKDLYEIKNYKEYFYEHEAKLFYSPTQPYKEVLKLIYNILPFLLRGNFNFYEPNIDILQDISMSEFYKKTLGLDSVLETLVNTLIEGYTYWGFQDYPANLALPAIIKITLNYLDKTKLMKGNTYKLIDRLKEHLEQRHVSFIMEREIRSTSEIDSDYKIIATTIDSDLFSEVLGTRVEQKYTKVLSIIIKSQSEIEINNSKDWTVFYVPKNESDLSIVSVYNIPYLRRTYQFFCLVNTEYTDDLLNNFTRQVKDIINIDEFDIVSKYYWKKTMPKLSTDLIRSVRKIQGINGIYFAGDYLGALPTMEAAIYHGKRASEMILNS